MNYSSKIYIVHIPVMVYTKEEKFKGKNGDN